MSQCADEHSSRVDPLSVRLKLVSNVFTYRNCDLKFLLIPTYYVRHKYWSIRIWDPNMNEVFLNLNRPWPTPGTIKYLPQAENFSNAYSIQRPSLGNSQPEQIAQFNAPGICSHSFSRLLRQNVWSDSGPKTARPSLCINTWYKFVRKFFGSSCFFNHLDQAKWGKIHTYTPGLFSLRIRAQDDSKNTFKIPGAGQAFPPSGNCQHHGIDWWC